MKHLFLYLAITLTLFSCTDTHIGSFESTYDNLNYESLTDATGTVYVKLDTMVKKYEKAKIVYSESDSSTLLIKTKENKFVYIQGPVVIELDSIAVSN